MRRGSRHCFETSVTWFMGVIAPSRLKIVDIISQIFLPLIVAKQAEIWWMVSLWCGTVHIISNYSQPNFSRVITLWKWNHSEPWYFRNFWTSSPSVWIWAEIVVAKCYFEAKALCILGDLCSWKFRKKKKNLGIYLLDKLETCCEVGCNTSRLE